MNQKQLEIFKTLAETLNFTRTAEQLYLSQTTVTLQIHNLEDELDLKLFERTSRSVRLTPAGNAFYEGAKQILDLINQTVDNTKIIAQGYTDLLEVGFVDESNRTGISGMVRDFIKLHPTTRANFSSAFPGDLINMLLADKCDVIFTPTFDKLNAANLKSHKIGTFRLMAAFNKEHPFNEKESVTFSDFAGERFIYVSNASSELDFTSDFVRQLEHNNVHINVVARTDNIASVFFMIEANLGVTVIPDYFYDRFHKDSNIRTCKIEGELKDLDFLATWKENKQSAIKDKFLNFLVEYFPDEEKVEE